MGGEARPKGSARVLECHRPRTSGTLRRGRHTARKLPAGGRCLAAPTSRGLGACLPLGPRVLPPLSPLWASGHYLRAPLPPPLPPPPPQGRANSFPALLSRSSPHSVPLLSPPLLLLGVEIAFQLPFAFPINPDSAIKPAGGAGREAAAGTGPLGAVASAPLPFRPRLLPAPPCAAGRPGRGAGTPGARSPPSERAVTRTEAPVGQGRGGRAGERRAEPVGAGQAPAAEVAPPPAPSRRSSHAPCQRASEQRRSVITAVRGAGVSSREGPG